MKKYIVLLRGINVGGYKKVPMADLRTSLEQSGFDNVKTYIQSGNVILESENLADEVKSLVAKTIQNTFGFKVSVLVKTPQGIQIIFYACPFDQIKKENSYFTFLDKLPDYENVEAINQIQFPDEEFVIKNDCIYFHSEHGYANAKFNTNFFENKLKVSATSRNYRTVKKLLELSV